MRWRKLGKIFQPSGELEWMFSHAAVPIAENVGGDIFRIYFSSRDRAARSHTGFVIVDINEPNKVIEVSPEPVLSPGQLGEFDDSGAMATWLVDSGRERFLYYIGWNLGVTVPFRNSIGLAISRDGVSFERYASGPIVDRSVREPHFCASCCVLRHGPKWLMWYLSCTEWQMVAGKPRHRYHIKYAESADGIQWQRDGHVAIDYENEREYAISRPSVVKDKDVWRMWFSHRGDSYRIGYAESMNGKSWKRLDASVGIDVSPSGWDADMIEYPFVFDHKGKRYMLYNGNDYGRTGFGLAVQD